MGLDIDKQVEPGNATSHIRLIRNPFALVTPIPIFYHPIVIKIPFTAFIAQFHSLFLEFFIIVSSRFRLFSIISDSTIRGSHHF